MLGLRDRALLLLGFAGAFGWSELVGLNVEDIEFLTEGLAVTLRQGDVLAWVNEKPSASEARAEGAYMLLR